MGGELAQEAPLFAPVARRNVYELVAENLIREIVAGRLRPGDVLPTERELTEAYRVGRSSVREALRILESRGVIQVAGHGAFTVSEGDALLNTPLQLLLSMDAADIRELFEIRRILEAETAGLAALRRSEADLGQLEASVDRMQGSLDSAEAYVEADLGFHITICRATGNRMASYLMNSIRRVLHETLMSVVLIPGSAQRSLEQHRLILAAIAEGDAADARRRMLEHLGRVETEVEATIRGSGPDQVPRVGRSESRRVAGGRAPRFERQEGQ